MRLLLRRGQAIFVENHSDKGKHMKDWIFKADEYICDLRTVGVLVPDGKLLVQHDRGGSEYALPGGHVRIGETTADGLVREYKEETGADIKVGKLLWTEECFWQWNGVKVHNIAFYYLIELAGDSDIPDTGVFISHKDNSRVVLGWVQIEKLADMRIYPEFIKEQIYNLDAAPRHFVTRDE